VLNKRVYLAECEDIIDLRPVIPREEQGSENIVHAFYPAKAQFVM
jgi:hypothetical protein